MEDDSEPVAVENNKHWFIRHDTQLHMYAHIQRYEYTCTCMYTILPSIPQPPSVVVAFLSPVGHVQSEVTPVPVTATAPAARAVSAFVLSLSHLIPALMHHIIICM